MLGTSVIHNFYYSHMKIVIQKSVVFARAFVASTIIKRRFQESNYFVHWYFKRQFLFEGPHKFLPSLYIEDPNSTLWTATKRAILLCSLRLAWGQLSHGSGWKETPHHNHHGWEGGVCTLFYHSNGNLGLQV